jgi:hypothetical protein
MSSRRFRISVVTGLFLLAAVLPGPAAARGPANEHARIVAHWTAERMASAVPREFVRTARDFQPVAKPDGKPGSGGATSTGASWNGGGLILRASGRVYFEMRGGAWLCSGAVASDTRTGESIVLTAAHCAYDEQGRAFATNWLFIPEFDSAPTYACSQSRHGCWTATALVVHDGYASAGGFNLQATKHDFAFAVVGPGGKSGTAELDATVGSFPITFSSLKSGSLLYAFGYPVGAPYNGIDLAYCAGKISGDPFNGGQTWAMSCKMTGGSSGGPWLSRFSTSTGSGTLSSVNSYIYGGIEKMHGPKFNATTQAAYNAASVATGNTIVGQ